MSFPISEISPIVPKKRKRLVFGFYSVPDLLTTLMIPSLVLQSIGAAIVWITALIGLIYPDAAVVKILFLVMIFDWMTGVCKAFKNKTFNSFTFQRMLLNLVLTFGLIGFTTQYVAHFWVFKILMLNEVLMAGFLLTYLVSVIENLHAIDEKIIPEKLYQYLKRILNLDTILKNYFTKNTNDKESTEEPAGNPDGAAGKLPNGENV